MGAFGGNRPGLRIERKGKLRLFVHDNEVGELRLTRKNIAKTDAIVENTEDNGEQTALSGALLELHGELVIMVAHAGFFAPRLLPCLIFRGTCEAENAEIFVQRTILELQTQQRGPDEQAFATLQFVIGLPVRINPCG